MHARFFSSFLAPVRKETGQALPLFAMGLVVFVGLVGLSVDIGQLVFTRTDLQKAADSAVFAGAQDLPSASAATTSAQSYVQKNGGTGTSATVTITAEGGAGNDTIAVTTTRHVDYFFLKVVGLSGSNVSAKAKAKAQGYLGGSGIMPLGLLADGLQNGKVHNNCYQGNDPKTGLPKFDQNIPCTLHDGASDCDPGIQCTGGDFGELALDGSGGADYKYALENGSKTVYKAGDQVATQTGNQVGPTVQGMAAHLAKPQPPGCGSGAIGDVLVKNAGGSSSIKPGCETSPNIWIIPVVNQFHNPQKSTILGFAFMYVTAASKQNGKNGHSVLSGQFIEFVTELPNAVYGAGGSSGATAIRLVE